MKFVEKLFWLTGTLLIALYFIGSSWAESSRLDAVEAFNAQKQQKAISQSLLRWAVAAPQLAQASVDRDKPALRTQSAVSPVVASSPEVGTIAMLRIPRIAMEVPVGYGTGERVLFRGAGVIEGTALPGTAGNVAIAAHRDSFFRGLKDVEVGDLIEIETLDRTETYRVSTLTVVEPSDVSVLAETSEHSLTLVTCYPFYFVGHAPQRFIVRALATDFHSQHPRRKP